LSSIARLLHYGRIEAHFEPVLLIAVFYRQRDFAFGFAVFETGFGFRCAHCSAGADGVIVGPDENGRNTRKLPCLVERELVCGSKTKKLTALPFLSLSFSSSEWWGGGWQQRVR